MYLYHISEDPSIAVFHPRLQKYLIEKHSRNGSTKPKRLCFSILFYQLKWYFIQMLYAFSTPDTQSISLSVQSGEMAT